MVEDLLVEIMKTNKGNVAKNARLYRARHSLGLSQKKAAEETGVSYAAYQFYERLVNYPNQSAQNMISSFYLDQGVPSSSPEYFFPPVLKEFSASKREDVLSHAQVKLCDPVLETRISEVLYEREVEQHAVQEYVHGLMQVLPSRHKQIVAMRFGLDSGNEKTLQEIGDTLNLTKEAIRQNLRKAISILKMKSRSDEIRYVR